MDAFISYRRDYGSDAALLYKKALEEIGFTVFLDHKNLHSGKFEQEILQEISLAPDFIVILSKNCLSQRDKEDVFIKEISFALKNNKNIIPIILSDYTPNDNISKDIEEISKWHGVLHNSQQFDSFNIPQLIDLLSDSETKRKYISSKKPSVIASREKIETEPLEKRWKDAISIDICSYFANMLINSEYIVKALKKGVNIRYIVVNPNSMAASESIKHIFPKGTKLSHFRRSFETAIELLQDIEEDKQLEVNDRVYKGKFEIRKTELFLPNSIMIIKNPDEYTNSIKIDFYTYNTDDAQRRSTQIMRTDIENYSFFENQFDYIWNSPATTIVDASEVL